MEHLLAVLALALGVMGMVAGEAHGSPGLQLLGVLLIVGAGVFAELAEVVGVPRRIDGVLELRR